ncbi:MAG: alkyl/aryl-sulfatase [Amphritea sp.]
MSPLDKLKQHNEQFTKGIQQLADGVYIAVGYAASNVAVIETDAGLVVVDTTESTSAAEAIMAELRKITQSPVTTIIYTHGHRDHVGGAAVFAADYAPQIIARANLKNELAAGAGRSNPDVLLRKRAARQFGIPLQVGTERINLGIGPADRPIEGMGQGYLAPTQTFSDEKLTLSIGGREIQLIAAPGETADQLMVWLPEEKILCVADNFYHSFPNLYAIRGTSYRDFEIWAATLDKMLHFDARLMLTGHGQPVSGADQIRQRLTDYRDAIQYIVEKSVEGMNKGLMPDQLVEYVRLPEHLSSKPYLQEFYGTVEWSVRAFFAGKIGWFDGNPSHLFPFSEQLQAERFAALIGEEKLLQTLHQAMEDEDYQWALHLSDSLSHIGRAEEILPVRIEALKMIADQQMNATARNYYLTCALELKQQLAVV